MWAALRAALQMFRAEKLRFLLTVSGIVVGVASLVLMASLLSVGQEVLREASATATGDDVITVQNDWLVTEQNPAAERLTYADQEAIAGSVLLPEGTQVTAALGLQDRKATWNGEAFDPLTIGVGPEVFGVYNLSVAEGRPFHQAEYDDARRVVLAGAQVLDGRLEPGDTVRVEGTPYLVVGILEEKAEMGPGGRWSWNNRLLFPARTYRLDLDPSRRPTSIVVKVATPPDYEGLVKDYVLATRGVLDAILARDRTVQSWRYEGVSDESGTEALIFGTIRALLYLTTLFSMIVGGINIMNIMLVTVAERTREIGVLRAVGATRTDILRQFVAETVMVTLIGAAIGLVVAVGLVGVGSLAMTAWVTAWPFRVEPWSVALGLGFSSIIGLVFGLYPAWRASRLDPVEALRFE